MSAMSFFNRLESIIANTHTSIETLRTDKYRLFSFIASVCLVAMGMLLEFFVIGAYFFYRFPGPGSFFLDSYGILSFLIPLYFIWAALILLDPQYLPSRIFLLNASLVPFLTLAIAFALFRNYAIWTEGFRFLQQIGRNGFSLFAILLTCLEIYGIRLCLRYFFSASGAVNPLLPNLSPNEETSLMLREEALQVESEEPAADTQEVVNATPMSEEPNPIADSSAATETTEKGGRKRTLFPLQLLLPSKPLGSQAEEDYSFREIFFPPAAIQQPQMGNYDIPAFKGLASSAAMDELDTLRQPPEGRASEPPPAMVWNGFIPELPNPSRSEVSKAPAEQIELGRMPDFIPDLDPLGTSERDGALAVQEPTEDDAALDASGLELLAIQEDELALTEDDAIQGDCPAANACPVLPNLSAALDAALPSALSAALPAALSVALSALPEALSAMPSGAEDWMDYASPPLAESDLDPPPLAESDRDPPSLADGDLDPTALADSAFDSPSFADASLDPLSEATLSALEQPAIADTPERPAGAQDGAVPSKPAPLKNRKWAPYAIPLEGVLNQYPDGQYWIIDQATYDAAATLKKTLEEFHIQAEVTGIRKGPVITMFEILPAPGVKLSRIVNLQDNIALRLAASSVRIVAPIPGKHAVGIEAPNRKRNIVSFREIIEGELCQDGKRAEIPIILGKDITGEAQTVDLTQMPHLLIAGATGSGKSVCVNAIILSILYQRSPGECRLMLIDPKIVELKLYNDIPHLLTPVITEPKRAFQALQYCIYEMERRYSCLDSMGVRDIRSYNKRIRERNIAAEHLPYIVVVIDEFADLMATTGKELESTVARLAAMSRAVGIHLVLATQRPSIDVITGLIKANIPSRIAFMVASKMDSRIIIDMVGAEKLLGKGDMLYAGAVDPFPTRIQGAYVSEEEVERVVEQVKALGAPDYIDDEIFFEDEEDSPSLFSEGDDPLYDKALEIVIQQGKASASYIQRRLKIGYNRAARLVEEMEERGVVGPAQGSKPRELLRGV